MSLEKDNSLGNGSPQVDSIIEEQSENIIEVKDIARENLELCLESDSSLRELYSDVIDFWNSSEEFNPQGTPMPDVMSEYTARYIQILAFELEKYLNPENLEKPWNPDDFELLYNFSLLLRVNVPDTIKPIADNTWDMLSQLRDRTLARNPEKKLLIRSFFTGSAVAEKELIRQMIELGQEKWSIVTTDIKAMSNAYSAINLAYLNSNLPEDQKFRIFVTDRSIDEEIEKIINENDRTVIIQKGKGEDECKYSGELEWDALLLDNGLPYVTEEVGESIVKEILDSKNSIDGIAINILGLDSNILVDIPDAEKYKEIFSFRNLFKKYKEIYTEHSPTNYPHRYEYNKDGELYTIYKVYSYGAAMLFTLIRKNLSKSGTIKSLINHATGLSRAKSDVITSPFDTHMSLITMFENDDSIEYEEIMRALDHKTFGFERRLAGNKWEFVDKKLDKRIEDEDFYKLCKDLDPLVLRTSRFWVS